MSGKHQDGALAIIGGSSLLHSTLFSDFEKIEVETNCGCVAFFRRVDKKVCFVQRHEADPQREYTPPHLINFPAIASALRSVGVTRVVSFASVGSLKPQSIRVGDVVVVDDHFCPFKLASYYAPASLTSPDPFRDSDASVQKLCHFISNMKTLTRDAVVARIQDCFPPEGSKERKLVTTGVYANALGPRFETRSEIKFYSAFADVIGMTASLEVSVLQEQNIDVAVVCMVDNLAVGLEDLTANQTELTMDRFYSSVRDNQKCVELIARNIVEKLLDFPTRFDDLVEH